MMIQGFWKIIKPFLHKQTVNKIQFIGSKYYHTLNEFIDERFLPDFFGGAAEEKLQSNPGVWQ